MRYVLIWGGLGRMGYVEVQEYIVPGGQAIQCKGKSRRLTRLDPAEGSGSSE